MRADVLLPSTPQAGEIGLAVPRRRKRWRRRRRQDTDVHTAAQVAADGDRVAAGTPLRPQPPENGNHSDPGQDIYRLQFHDEDDTITLVPNIVSTHIVGTTVTLLLPAAKRWRRIVVAQYAGQGGVYVRFDRDVSITKGYILPAFQAPLVIFLEPGESLFAIGQAAADAVCLIAQIIEPQLDPFQFR